MQIHTSDNPAKEAGIYISDSINAHNGDVLCLLSGGSALDVVKHITTNKSECRAPRALPTASPKGRTEDDKKERERECRTICFMMGDERVSRESGINNFLQLKERYPEHPVVEQAIETVPELGESAEAFAKRIEKNILQIISGANNLKIVSLQGLGGDGHTAGIFPMDRESFQKTYRDDGTYVPVHIESLTIDSRASITPTWIQKHVDEIFLFAAGESKHVILESLINESKELHERPAELIKRHPNAQLFTNLHIEPK